MMHRLTRRLTPRIRWRNAAAPLGPRPWCFTCDVPGCGSAPLIIAGPRASRARLGAWVLGWHVTRYGCACPTCDAEWDRLMMSAAHRDLSLMPHLTPDPDLTATPYRLIRETPRRPQPPVRMRGGTR